VMLRRTDFFAIASLHTCELLAHYRKVRYCDL
jgi:hypothetical protein